MHGIEELEAQVNSITCPEKGKQLEFCHLIQSPATRKVWDPLISDATTDRKSVVASLNMVHLVSTHAQPQSFLDLFEWTYVHHYFCVNCALVLWDVACSHKCDGFSAPKAVNFRGHGGVPNLSGGRALNEVTKLQLLTYHHPS